MGFHGVNFSLYYLMTLEHTHITQLPSPTKTVHINYKIINNSPERASYLYKMCLPGGICAIIITMLSFIFCTSKQQQVRSQWYQHKIVPLSLTSTYKILNTCSEKSEYCCVSFIERTSVNILRIIFFFSEKNKSTTKCQQKQDS